MSKNYILALCTAFILVISTLIFIIFFQETRHQGHLYVNVSGGLATATLGSYHLDSFPLVNFTAPVGTYPFTLKTDTFETTFPVTLTAGTATIIDRQIGTTLPTSSGLLYELQSLDNHQTQLTVKSLPDQALTEIDYDQQNSQITPFNLDNLSAGEHSLTLNLPGYTSLTAPFTLTPGYHLTITANLAQKQ